MRPMLSLFAIAFSSFLFIACGTLPPGPVTPFDMESALAKRRESSAERALQELKMRKRSPRRVTSVTPEVPWEEDLRTTHIKKSQSREQAAVDQMPTSVLRPERLDAEMISESEGKPEFENKAPLEDSEHAVLHLYRDGLRYLQSRNWDASISAFDQFLKAAPEHIYADRAAYWISHCHYMAGDHGLAVYTSNQFESRYPHSQRLPEMIYYRALSLVELGQYEEAVPELRSLLSKFPASEWASDASRRLAKLVVQKDTGSP